MSDLSQITVSVKALPSRCHSHSGLACEPDDYGSCFLIDRSEVLALLEGEADPEARLICPDPDAHVRPCTFRPAWAQPCGKLADDPIHPGPDDRKMPGQHVYRSEGR